MIGTRINAISGISAFTKYGYNTGGSFLVSRFDGQGSWQDDLLQAGASTVAMLATDAILSGGNTLGTFVVERNAVFSVQRFIQGTLKMYCYQPEDVGRQRRGRIIYG